eukprot:CAMPEP_0183296656 /NCGR_PEP_ID=MMETSP0160_2-20130417/4109_1 /TAXON_ID=2839 ORGANISM="Odontella Sinensis, Strain Grunow 1884" /NCGR_SAMPLE_ID=MMETSP0160_2 /ASSEMBLY_ACC=CAM_ASM_000250 /LENGTH=402 /DNA_ID=CAMNT_0025458289 /DNA_START=23 /DNA_END=1231 /DNA_ORIENTATION=-
MAPLFIRSCRRSRNFFASASLLLYATKTATAGQACGSGSSVPCLASLPRQSAAGLARRRTPVAVSPFQTGTPLTRRLDSGLSRSDDLHGTMYPRSAAEATTDLRLAPSDEETSSSSSALDSRITLLAGAAASLSFVAGLAASGILPGPTFPSEMGFAPYSSELIIRDVGATVLTLSLAYAFVKSITFLAKRGILESRDSRKVIHTLSAPLFILFWPLFSDAVGASAFGAIVPLLNGARLVAAGAGGTDEGDKELANAVSRSGSASEALGGPLLYCIVLFFSTLIFWRDSLIGVAAVSVMAAGDGMADIIGRRFGRGNKWWFSNDKSIAGSAAFAISGAVVSTGLAWWLAYTGVWMPPMAMVDVAQRLAIINILSAAVELVPIGDDNWTVPLTAGILAAALIQ